MPCLRRIARSTKSARGLGKLLNDAIESGIADLSHSKPKDRVDELRATCDQACAGAEPAIQNGA
jgi:hypothetical protein